MNNIEMKTPEGYFEDSFARTMSGVSAIRRRRKTVLGVAAAIVLVAGAAFMARRVSYVQEEKAFLAQQSELADLDIFLEIN
jgi:hypothetical protein